MVPPDLLRTALTVASYPNLLNMSWTRWTIATASSRVPNWEAAKAKFGHDNSAAANAKASTAGFSVEVFLLTVSIDCRPAPSHIFDLPNFVWCLCSATSALGFVSIARNREQPGRCIARNREEQMKFGRQYESWGHSPAKARGGTSIAMPPAL